MPRSRKPMSKRRRMMMGVSLGLLNNIEKKLQEESDILYKNKKLFLKDYRKLCRKYKCYVGGNLQSISVQIKGENINTITSHLQGLK